MKVLFVLIYTLLFEITIIFTNLVWFKFFQSYSSHTRFLFSLPLIVMSQYFIMKTLTYSVNITTTNILLMILSVVGSFICDTIIKNNLSFKFIDILLMLTTLMLSIILVYRINK